jgi:alpha-tubulin suppressor-like RCC1 family protein
MQQGFDIVEVPSRIEGLANIVAVSCGDNHSLALSQTGHVYFFGSYRLNNGDLIAELGADGLVVERAYRFVQLTLPDRVAKIASGATASAVVTVSGLCYTRGLGTLARNNPRNYDLSLQPVIYDQPNLPRRVSDVSVGKYHFLAVVFEGENPNSVVYSAGSNVYGQLGFENVTEEADRPIEDIPVLSRVSISGDFTWDFSIIFLSFI